MIKSFIFLAFCFNSIFSFLTSLAVSPKYNLEGNYFFQKQDTVLQTGWYNVADFPDDSYPFVHVDKTTGENDNYYVIPKPVISLKNIQKVEIVNSENPKLIMHFNTEGKVLWEKLTEQNIGGRLVFICDNKLVQVFIITQKDVSGIAEINRINYNLKELTAFKSHIEKEMKKYK